MSADPATIEYYETNAPNYTLSFGQAPSRHLDAFLDCLEPDAHILELGCGGGRDAAYMAERGFSLDTTDGTAAMVRKARERTGLPVRQMRFDELDAYEEYDAVWAHACLLHVAWEELPGVLAAIRKALVRGGLHFANYKLGPAGEEGEGRDLLGRLTNLPKQEWLEELYRKAEFEIVAIDRYRGSGADGTVRDWLALTVRKEAG